MYGHTAGIGTERGGRSSHGHHRGGRPPRYGQPVVYPTCATEQEALQCVLYVHDHVTRILNKARDTSTHVVHVSCSATVARHYGGKRPRSICVGRRMQKHAQCKGMPLKLQHFPTEGPSLSYGNWFPPHRACMSLSSAVSPARGRRAPHPRPCIQADN
jgi:hypothetical protein